MSLAGFYMLMPCFHLENGGNAPNLQRFYC